MGRHLLHDGQLLLAHDARENASWHDTVRAVVLRTLGGLRPCDEAFCFRATSAVSHHGIPAFMPVLCQGCSEVGFPQNEGRKNARVLAMSKRNPAHENAMHAEALHGCEQPALLELYNASISKVLVFVLEASETLEDKYGGFH